MKKEEKKLSKEVQPIMRTPQRTVGQIAADSLTKWVGSWTFILLFLVFLGCWMTLNIAAWIGKWDPFPFILLNLVLSSLAAIQAPLILMSQNRQSQIDRQKSEYDYLIDRKAEREIQEIKKVLDRIEKKIS